MIELIFLKALMLNNVKKRRDNVVCANFIILLIKTLIIKTIYAMDVTICP